MNVDRDRRTIAKGLLLLGAGALGYRVSAQEPVPVIRVAAKQYSFTPRDIQLKKDTSVILEMTTADVAMGFNAPAFGTRADIVPGKVTQVRLAATRTGTFEFTCDVFCGFGHGNMKGTITVTD